MNLTDSLLLIMALLVFSAAAVTMLLLPLVIGKFVRPNKPNVEKKDIYECGEPTIGASNVQFDLRFYVVALLFIVFDVEIAFFFPWAVVFGKANTLGNTMITRQQREEVSEWFLPAAGSETSAAVATGAASAEKPMVSVRAARLLMKAALADLVVFFFVVLVGFAYVWKRGDLDWVRAVAQERIAAAATTRPPAIEAKSVLSA